jgi:hypothetical protein
MIADFQAALPRWIDAAPNWLLRRSTGVAASDISTEKIASSATNLS